MLLLLDHGPHSEKLVLDNLGGTCKVWGQRGRKGGTTVVPAQEMQVSKNMSHIYLAQWSWQEPIYAEG